MYTIASTDPSGVRVDLATFHLAGAPTAPPLLISHATGFHARCYGPLAHSLGDRYDVIGFDHRGHGQTRSPPEWNVDWRGYGADTTAVAGHLAARSDHPVVGFGHSMGAATLLLAAHARPDLFDRLVLFEPIAFPPTETPAGADENPLVAGARRRRRRFDSVDAALANYSAKPPLAWFTPDALRRYVDYGFRRDSKGITLCCTPEHEAATFTTAHTSGVWDRLSDVVVPTVVIGSGDGEPPGLIAPKVAERLARGTFVGRPEMTHFGPFTHPAEVAALVDAGA